MMANQEGIHKGIIPLVLIFHSCAPAWTFPFGPQPYQSPIWDTEYCSNVNPIIDNNTIVLSALGGKVKGMNPFVVLCYFLRARFFFLFVGKSGTGLVRLKKRGSFTHR